jgi:restriction system protein
MNPFDFQKLVGDLLAAMGYHVVWIAPPGKDGGVDVIAHTDPLGINPPRIKTQVKRTTDKVNVDSLKSFVAIIHEGDVGIYVSTGGFTKDAVDFARSQEQRKITLIDLRRFLELWIEHFTKLSDSAQRRFPLKRIFFLAPDG